MILIPSGPMDYSYKLLFIVKQTKGFSNDILFIKWVDGWMDDPHLKVICHFRYLGSVYVGIM